MPEVKRVALVTGGARGLGLAIAERLGQDGFQLALGDIQFDTARKAASQLSAAGRKASAFALDVASEADVARAFAEIEKTFGRLDVLVNNAGVLGGDHQGIDDVDYGAWLNTLEVNTLAPFRLATALLANLKRSKRPRIVTLSSQMGSLNQKSVGAYAYRSSKAAVNKLMQVLAAELEKDGIIVCPVHPGWVRTDMGGPNAEISVEESAAGLFDLIETMTMAHSGRFWTWEGKEHPW